MAKQTLDQAFEEICKELLLTFLKKHKDYGKGNILSVRELGIALRLTEKVERAKNLLMKGGTATNESLDDTWTDIAVYAVIAKLLSSGKFETLEVNPTKLAEV
jgi:hypothetical protein